MLSVATFNPDSQRLLLQQRLTLAQVKSNCHLMDTRDNKKLE